ncbi:hypothetical protein ANCCEY_09792 [Ancylostoma ceylanicum]|uniref:RING-type domain-containing protein n=1 Tax=Ancylostoma ceylanicum TaxID=53326 RepID=A0A0D6LGA7_9BILA|nr:hypothetical protein ANCCEY_09792 [Ancylostoma ceylanicum]
MNDCSSGRLVSFLVEGDDVVSCEVCLEPFQPVERPPKILPCGHNFCDQCLFSLCCHQQYYLLDSIRCPTCRASFPTDVAKVAPTNWDLCKILENVQRGREVNVTVIHVPDTPTQVLPSTSQSTKNKCPERASTIRTQREKCGDCKRKLSTKILAKAARFCQNCSKGEATTFYCLECCVNKHNGHSLLSLSQLQTAQLKGELNEAITALDDAIRLIESTAVLHPHKLSEIQTKQVRKCSRLLCCSQELREDSGSACISSLIALTQLLLPNYGFFADVSSSSLYQRISTPRAKNALDVGSLDFLLAALPKLLPGSELLRLLEKTSHVDKAEERMETFLKAAAIITTILYDDVPKEELALYADALLICFHQANTLSRRASPSKPNSRKLVWKGVQMAYTELLRVGAKNYPSYHPERIALLDDLAYLCHLYADVCDQATVTICMIEAARARASDEKLEEEERLSVVQRLKVRSRLPPPGMPQAAEAARAANNKIGKEKQTKTDMEISIPTLQVGQMRSRVLPR